MHTSRFRFLSFRINNLNQDTYRATLSEKTANPKKNSSSDLEQNAVNPLQYFAALTTLDYPSYLLRKDYWQKREVENYYQAVQYLDATHEQQFATDLAQIDGVKIHTDSGPQIFSKDQFKEFIQSRYTQNAPGDHFLNFVLAHFKKPSEAKKFLFNLNHTVEEFGSKVLEHQMVIKAEQGLELDLVESKRNESKARKILFEQKDEKSFALEITNSYYFLETKAGAVYQGDGKIHFVRPDNIFFQINFSHFSKFLHSLIAKFEQQNLVYDDFFTIQVYQQLFDNIYGQHSISDLINDVKNNLAKWFKQKDAAAVAQYVKAIEVQLKHLRSQQDSICYYDPEIKEWFVDALEPLVEIYSKYQIHLGEDEEAKVFAHNQELVTTFALNHESLHYIGPKYAGMMATEHEPFYLLTKLPLAVLQNVFTAKPEFLDLQDNHGNTILHYAVMLGRISLVRWLLEQDLTIKANYFGEWPWQWAADIGFNKLFNLFTRKDLELDLLAKDKQRRTALHSALAAGNLAGSGLLLTRVKEDLTDGYGRSLWHYLAMSDNPATIMLMKDPEQINVVDKNGATPLHYAAKYNRPKMIRALLAHDADPELFDNDGCNALTIAAQNNCLAACKELVAAGLECKADVLGNTPLHYAAQNGAWELFMFLAEHPYFKQNPEAYWQLLNTGNKLGNNVLHTALRSGDEQLILQLLNSPQVDKRKTNTAGITPLMLATIVGNEEAVETIICFVNDFEICDKLGANVFHHAARSYNLACLKMLLESELAALEPDSVALALLQKDKYNKTVIDYLLSYYGGENIFHVLGATGDTKILELILLAEKCSESHEQIRKLINQYDGQGLTPLHLAIENDHNPMLQALLQLGANPEIKTKAGETAISKAACLSSKEIFATLIYHGVDLTQCDNHNSSAFHHLLTEKRYDVLTTHLPEVSELYEQDYFNRLMNLIDDSGSRLVDLICASEEPEIESLVQNLGLHNIPNLAMTNPEIAKGNTK